MGSIKPLFSDDLSNLSGHLICKHISNLTINNYKQKRELYFKKEYYIFFKVLYLQESRQLIEITERSQVFTWSEVR
jgi:hypothetical protein